jgi:cytochrome P450
MPWAMTERVLSLPAAINIKKNPELVNQHRAFGNGEHFCIGAHMSRLEMQVMFEEFIPRLRNPQFAKPVEYVRDYFVNSIKAMQISFTPEIK